MQYASFVRACVLAGTLAGSTACQDDATPIVRERCTDDDFCGPGFVCELGDCVPVDAVSCQEVEGGQAILQPSPIRLDFGFTGSGTSQQPLLLRNIGNCTVTVFEAGFARGASSAFECPFCSPDRFPIDLFPFREHELTVFFTPEGVGTFEDAVVLLSDDSEFTEIRVPVRATFNGIPAAAVTPDRVDFDFVPVGRSGARTLDIRNRGTGIAPLEIRQIEIETATASAFSIASALDDSDQPIILRPLASGADDKLTVNLRYRPQEVEAHVGDLVIHTNEPGNSVLRIPLAGSSKTPAKISVSTDRIEFGAVPIGQTTAVTLTIVNEGGTPLRINYRWGGAGLTTDFSALPAVVPPVPAGEFTEMQVLVIATAPRPIEGLLILESNDPNRPTVTVPVSAVGESVAGAQVIKIDMNFDNGQDSLFDDDFRNVDMTLENPFGLVVNKQFPEPSNWNQFGNPSWISFGPKEEPERIVLPDAQADGTYRVLLTYQEDCASVPSGLVAAVLGISVEALITYLSGGGNLGVGSGEVSEAIENLCLDREPSLATVTIYVNGLVVAEVPVTLGRKSDSIYAADLIRQNGQFTVRP